MNKRISLPSDVKNFQKAAKISLELLDSLNPGAFYSPYSVIPLVSQIFGLNTPLMGTGNSLYSLIAHVLKLQNKRRLFQEIFKIDLRQKRLIIDEMYEMIAPSLLAREDDYIALLCRTKYKQYLAADKRKISQFKKNFSEKFRVFSPFIRKFHNQNVDFGYIVHYGYPEDLYREFNFLEKLPESLAREWRENSLPVVNEVILKNFPVVKGKTKKEIKGWVLFITNHTKELLESGDLRRRKILQAAKLAEKLGAKMIGMGGLIASFAQGGKWLSEKIPGVGFTTGHAYTIGNIMQILDECAKKTGLDIKKSTIAVVGAAGSIGSGCAKLLAEKKPRKIILLDLNTFDALRKLEEVSDNIKKIEKGIIVAPSISFSALKKADVIIVATNSVASIIKKEYLSRGVIIIDDSFPKNVNKEILKERPDIVLLEGGMMCLPDTIEVQSSRNMPDLMDAPLNRLISCKEIYGCVAEIFVLSLYKIKKSFGLGYSNPKLAKKILLMAKRVKFSCAPLQCYDEAVGVNRLDKAVEHFREKGIRRK